MYASVPKLGVFTSTAVENYRPLDAHRFFKSGWVQTVYHKNITPEHVVFMADVRPSYRVTEQPHHPWVAVSRDAKVLTAHCDCMARWVSQSMQVRPPGCRQLLALQRLQIVDIFYSSLLDWLEETKYKLYIL